MSRVLLVDVGNTSATIGLASRGRVSRRARVLVKSACIGTVRAALRRVVGQQKADAAVYCSVVPSQDRLWIMRLREFTRVAPLVVTDKLDFGIKVSYPAPASIGHDRLANACGAFYRYGAPVVVADFGTALTFDVVLCDRGFVGGVIAPGPALVMDYLAERTELLPRVRIGGRFGVFGRSTVEAMRIGGTVGYQGLVRGITEHLLAGLKKKRIRLCATGGYARTVLRGMDCGFVVDSDLTLFGLYRIHQLNK